MWFILFIYSLLYLPNVTDYKSYLIEGKAQGTTYRVLYYANDSLVTIKMMDDLLDGIDSSLSLYKPYSLINHFNNEPGGLTMDSHFEKVLTASLETWRETNGLFDITVKPLVQAWGFGVKKGMTIPTQDSINQLLECTGSDKLIITGHTVSKKIACLQIDMNGIAQGYSVDMMAGLLEQAGIRNYLVELGGEIRIKGRKQPSEEMFQIGIESPETNEWDQPILKRQIQIPEGAVTTSGSYRNYYESNGTKANHIIHPKTGYPVKNDLISVTVWARDAMTADAYDNALMLMGLANALEFIEAKKDMAAYFIYRDERGEIKDTASSGFLKKIFMKMN